MSDTPTTELLIRVRADRRDGEPVNATDAEAINALMWELLCRKETRRYFGAYALLGCGTQIVNEGERLYTESEMEAHAAATRQAVADAVLDTHATIRELPEDVQMNTAFDSIDAVCDVAHARALAAALPPLPSPR